MAIKTHYEQIVIIGAGEAGVAASAALRASGYAGRILLLSGEDHYPYERPPLSKEFITAAKPAATLIRPAAWYVEQRINLQLGTWAAGVDPKTRRVRVERGANAEEIPYDALLFATGSIARQLPIEGTLHLRNAKDAQALRARLQRPGNGLIVGGGIIGLELASTAHALGWQLSLVEAAPTLMERVLAPEISSWLYDQHVDAGLHVHLGTTATGVVPAGGREVVHLSSGSVVEADVIIAGIGAEPDTRLASEAGCEIDDGIVVDAMGRTLIEGIFAAGEVARFPHPLYGRLLRLEAWQHAGHHGGHVGRAMTGADPDAYNPVPWFWTDQLGHNIQIAGIPAECDRTLWREASQRGIALHFIGNRLSAVTAIDNGRDMRAAMRIIARGWSGDPETLAKNPESLAAIAARLTAQPEEADRAV